MAKKPTARAPKAAPKAEKKTRAKPGPKPPVIDHLEGIITITQAGKLLGLSRARINQLRAQGVFTPNDKGRYRVQDVVLGYVGFLKSEERRTSKSATQNRVQDARAKEIEMRLAEKNRTLIPLEDASNAMDAVVGKVAREFGGLPARLTRDRELRKKIEAQVDQSLDRIAKALSDASGTLAEGGDVLETVAKGSAR